MRLFAAQQSGKVAIVPSWIGQHLAVDTEHQAGSLGGVASAPFILHPGDDRQPIPLELVLKGMTNAVDCAGKAGRGTFDPLHFHIGPRGPSERPMAKGHRLPCVAVLYLHRANRSVVAQIDPHAGTGQGPAGSSFSAQSWCLRCE